MSTAHLLCLFTGSALSPMILQLRFSNSGCNPAIYPSSVVHTGVKSLGCENKIAQPSPIHSWKLIVPCEVSAVKSGAVSLMRKMNCPPEAGDIIHRSFDRSRFAGNAPRLVALGFLPHHSALGNNPRA